MNIRLRKRIKCFLHILLSKYQQEEHTYMSLELKEVLSKEDIAETLRFFDAEAYGKESFEDLSHEDMCGLVGGDSKILSHSIYEFEHFFMLPKLDDSDVKKMLYKYGFESHYLFYKPCSVWDAYDQSNYFSLLRSCGALRKAFALCHHGITQQNVYQAENKPEFFFDTEKEAKEELQRMIADGKTKAGELKIIEMNIYN